LEAREKVSAIGVGGWHLSLKHVDEKLSLRIVRTAIDRGVNFMDNSWDYSDGESERRMGKALGDQAFSAVESFHPLSNDERDALLARTREAAATGRFEPFKTSSIFDGTAENPQWLGEEPVKLRGLMPA
jgi:Aldo/keto reductase family